MKTTSKKAPLTPEYTQELKFAAIAGKPVVVDFKGGEITSDGGLCLFSEADKVLGLSSALSSVLTEWRAQSKVVHDMKSLLAQRMFAIGAGYADCNDHKTLRRDPALKMACDKAPIDSPDLASQPTLSRFENHVSKRDLVRLAIAQGRCMIEKLPSATRRIILDVDATDDAAHGAQQLVMFNGYYAHRCYCPLLLHMTPEDGKQRPLGALLRAGNAGPCDGLGFMVRRAVAELRRRFPDVQIILRADGAYGCQEVLGLCERLKIDFILGLKGNARLHELCSAAQTRAAVRHGFVDDRVFAQFSYQAKVWSQAQRVIVKAQAQANEVKCRYVVTNLPCNSFDEAAQAEDMYGQYCGRGEQENRIKELKLDLESGRTSCSSYKANQFRLILHLAACMVWNVVQQGLRKVAHGSDWADFQVKSLRERLIKLGARVVQSSRRVVMHASSSYPHAHIWHLLYAHWRPSLC